MKKNEKGIALSSLLLIIAIAIVLIISGLIFPGLGGVPGGILLGWPGRDRCRCPRGGCRYRIPRESPGGRGPISVCRSFHIFLRGNGSRFVGRRYISRGRHDPVGSRLVCGCRCYPNRVVS